MTLNVTLSIVSSIWLHRNHAEIVNAQVLPRVNQQCGVDFFDD
jgi:hypothetical protein